MLFLRRLLDINDFLAGTGPSFGRVRLVVGFVSHRLCNGGLSNDESLTSARWNSEWELERVRRVWGSTR